jgi:hypothetical protein
VPGQTALTPGTDAKQTTPFASNQTECEQIVDAMTPLTPGVTQEATRQSTISLLPHYPLTFAAEYLPAVRKRPFPRAPQGPRDTRHAYRNRGDETAHMVCHVRPPSSLQEFLEDVAALARAGTISRRGLPTSYGALLEAAAIAHRHREMVTLLFPPMPPRFIQRLIFPSLARIGEGRGKKPRE